MDFGGKSSHGTKVDAKNKTIYEGLSAYVKLGLHSHE